MKIFFFALPLQFNSKLCNAKISFELKFFHFLLLFIQSRADEKFRKTLVSTVPLSDALLKILLQEEGNAISEASKSIQGATQKVIGVKDSIVGYFGDDKSAKPVEKPAPAKSTDEF